MERPKLEKLFFISFSRQRFSKLVALTFVCFESFCSRGQANLRFLCYMQIYYAYNYWFDDFYLSKPVIIVDGDNAFCSGCDMRVIIVPFSLVYVVTWMLSWLVYFVLTFKVGMKNDCLYCKYYYFNQFLKTNSALYEDFCFLIY